MKGIKPSLEDAFQDINSTSRDGLGRWKTPSQKRSQAGEYINSHRKIMTNIKTWSVFFKKNNKKAVFSTEIPVFETSLGLERSSRASHGSTGGRREPFEGGGGFNGGPWRKTRQDLDKMWRQMCANHELTL